MVLGSWEEQNLVVSARAARRLFRVDLMAPSGLYTLKTKSEDILVAHWDLPDATTLARGIWLWNAPASDTLVFEVDPSVLQRNALAAFLERTVIWSDDGGPTNRVEVRFDSSGIAAGTGSFEHVPPGVACWRVAASEVGDVAFVSIAWDKGNSDENPVGTVFVPERFPPLAVRLKALSREELFGEIGKQPYSPANLGMRDEVVIGELLSRGDLSESDFRRLIFPRGHGPVGKSANEQLNAVLSALNRSKELPRYAAMITNVLLTTLPERGVDYVGHYDAVNWLGALNRAGINPSDEP